MKRSVAPLIRDLSKIGICYGPGSAAHHHSASKTRVNALMVLRCARDTSRSYTFRNAIKILSGVNGISVSGFAASGRRAVVDGAAEV